MSLALDATEVSFTKVMNTCVALPPTDVCDWAPPWRLHKSVLIGSHGIHLLRKRAALSQTLYSAIVWVFRAHTSPFVNLSGQPCTRSHWMLVARRTSEITARRRAAISHVFAVESASGLHYFEKAQDGSLRWSNGSLARRPRLRELAAVKQLRVERRQGWRPPSKCARARASWIAC